MQKHSFSSVFPRHVSVFLNKDDSLINADHLNLLGILIGPLCFYFRYVCPPRIAIMV